jgi:hypothetical protein
MKKIANGDGVVIVGLTTQEFTRLADKSPDDMSFGEDISLLPIKQKLDLIDAKEAELLDVKTAASNLVTKLTAVGI